MTRSRTGGNGSDKREPETIDGDTGKPEDTPRRIDLSTLRDVRLELAWLYRQVDAGDMDSTEGNKRAWMLRQIHDVLVSAELERRIMELEEMQLRPGNGTQALAYRRGLCEPLKRD